MSDGGKGSSPRPFSVSQEEFANNFDRTFRKDKRLEEEQKEEDDARKFFLPFENVNSRARASMLPCMRSPG